MKAIIFIVLLSLCVAEDNLNVIGVHKAWEKYPSASIKIDTKEIELPDIKKLKESHGKILAKIKEEKLMKLKRQINSILSNDSTYQGHMEAGIVYAQNSFYTEAMREFKISLSMNETSLIYANIANIYYIKDKYRSAHNCYLKALKLDRNNPDILLSLAFLNYEYGKFETAKKYYCTALMLDPTLLRDDHIIIAQTGTGASTAPKASNKGVTKIAARWLRK